MILERENTIKSLQNNKVENFFGINIQELAFINKINIFNEKVDYFNKKENLEKISNQNTWNNVNKKLTGLINEN